MGFFLSKLQQNIFGENLLNREENDKSNLVNEINAIAIKNVPCVIFLGWRVEISTIQGWK